MAPLRIAGVRIAGIAIVVLAALAEGGLSAQDWRAPALAAFDDTWQTINDTFYDPTFGGVDWAAARDELRPRVEAAASADDARAVIRELLARLGHSHFMLLSRAPSGAGGGPAVVPIDTRASADGLIVTVVERAGFDELVGYRAVIGMSLVVGLVLAGIFLVVSPAVEVEVSAAPRGGRLRRAGPGPTCC